MQLGVQLFMAHLGRLQKPQVHRFRMLLLISLCVHSQQMTLPTTVLVALLVSLASWQQTNAYKNIVASQMPPS